MKSKLGLIVCKIIVCQYFVLQATAGQTNTTLNPTHQLSEKLHNTIMSHGKNVDCADAFESIIINSTNAVELATARVYLASCLFHGISVENAGSSVQRIYQICENVPNTPSTQWQAAAAKVIIVATKAFEGKRQESIILSHAALESIDFETIEQEESIAWNILKKDFQGGEYVLRETLKANIANELSNSGQPSEAEKIWRTMIDGDFRFQMAERIVDEYVSQESRALEKHFEDGHGDQHAILVQILLDGVLDELIRSGEWTSLSMPARLEVVARHATNAPVAATANVLLARHMLDRLSDEAAAGEQGVKVPNRLYRLCRGASEMPPESWQSALSAWIVASAMLLEGKTADARAVAESALKKTDFESLEKLEDKAWLAARKTLGKSPFVLRVSLNSVLKLSQVKVEPEVMRQPVAAEIPVN